MAEEVELTIIRGLPFRRLIRVVGGKNIWPELTDFEVRAQLRKKQPVGSEFIADLHPFMTKAYGVGLKVDDIEITWFMTGAQTRAMTEKGYFDVILSDPGVTDLRGIKAVFGSIILEDLTTSAEG